MGQKQLLPPHIQGTIQLKLLAYRPSAYIYAFTNNHTILNTLSLVWGVKAFYYDGGVTTDQTVLETKKTLKKQKYVKKGDMVINIKYTWRKKGMTNMIKLSKVM